MNYKHSCVIDSAGYYKTLVLILIEPDQNGEVIEKIQYYELQDGESLLDVYAPSNFVRPCWNGSEWSEGATLEEVEEWEAAQPKPVPLVPSPMDILGQQVALLTLESAQRDSLINTIGAQTARLSLEGGAEV